MAQAQISSIAEHKWETASYHHTGQSDHPGIGIQVNKGVLNLLPMAHVAGKHGEYLMSEHNIITGSQIMVMAMWLLVQKMTDFFVVLALYTSLLVSFYNKNIKMCT